MVDILLNVYDITKYNWWLEFVGMGAYHTAIQVDGVEYNYGGADSEVSGVYQSAPNTQPQYTFKAQFKLGTVNASVKQVVSKIDNLRAKFKANEYNLVSQNCNHFTNELCMELLGFPIPEFVNRGAWLASG